MTTHDTVKVARFRASIVRETMRECAKLMCDTCRCGGGVVPSNKSTSPLFGHYDAGEGTEEVCSATDIYALLAETEAK